MLRALPLLSILGLAYPSAAGETMLARDGVAALAANPAVLARRLARRAQVGLALVDQDVRFRTRESFPQGSSPEVRDDAAAAVAPWGGAQVGVGERFVLGAGVLSAEDLSLSAPAPAGAWSAAADDRHRYPARYAGTRLRWRAQAAALGAGARVASWLALGAAALLERTSLAHERVLWAGPATGVATLADLSPAYDMTFSAEARAWVPGAAAGFVVAPAELPLELGGSVRWTAEARLDGEAALDDARGGTIQGRAAATSSLRLPGSWALRGGARAAFSRLVVELDAQMGLVSSTPLVWSLAGMSFVPEDGVPRPLGAAPVGFAVERAWAASGGIDVDVATGVTVSAGYGWARRPPVGAAHTFSTGAQARVDEAAVTLVVARSWRPPRDASGPPVESLLEPVDLPAAAGRVTAWATRVELSLELPLP